MDVQDAFFSDHFDLGYMCVKNNMQQMFLDPENEFGYFTQFFQACCFASASMPLTFRVSPLARILSFMIQIQFKRLKPMIPYPAP